MFHRPERFVQSDADAIALIQRLRFGTIVSVKDGEPEFSHLPLLADVEDGRLVRLRGHFARSNPHWRSLESSPKAVVIFNGPNAYTSAQWYVPGHPAAPTWNFVHVHVEGNFELLPDAENTNRIINDLVLVNEAALPTQWDLAGYSPDRRAALVPHIIGFHFHVTKLDPYFKLSQHYSDANKKGAARGLKSVGTDAAREIADMMLGTCSDGGDRAGVDVRSILSSSKTPHDR
jgi:transcriptional regulator